MVDDIIPTVTEVNLTKDIPTSFKFLNHYKLISKIGNGHDGKVYLAENKFTGDKVAIKEITKLSKISILNKNPNLQINKIYNEINIMKLIQNDKIHPNITKLHEVLDDRTFNKIFLVFEYCNKYDLKFGASYPYTFGQLHHILTQILLGLEFIHGLGIIHRDIKPSNILRNNNEVKVTDFGISCTKFNQNLSSLGTPAFMAPELCTFSNESNNEEEIGTEIDIWSLGVTLFCLRYGRLPFRGNNEYELFNEIIYNDVKFDQSTIPNDNDENEKHNELEDLMSKMLIKNPKKRITLSEMKTHGFIKNGFASNDYKNFMKFNELYLFNDELKRSNSIPQKFKKLFVRRKSISSASMTTSTSAAISPTIPLSRPPLENTLSQPLIKQNKLSSSSNSLNLNSLLRSKKEVSNYLDDTTLFQNFDSDSDSGSSTDDDANSDNEGFYNDKDNSLSFRIGPKRTQSGFNVKTVNDYLDI
ncbi:hypothetical protein WICMUC_003809 [Wickerhamomyces mucosus]|uniref:Protein kinase domain-containing protein n=1 Tax=Wickerhamomyces mucosus TaxID=1378264 RepID=A0A9P8TCG6_9ASCO|nr:hypothetical protein WICMUC_003809 [Wickerhamomyces mucosus]